MLKADASYSHEVKFIYLCVCVCNLFQTYAHENFSHIFSIKFAVLVFSFISIFTFVLILLRCELRMKVCIFAYG
jgi:hypothetical protein